MTPEQINVALAEWHSEHDGFCNYNFENGTLWFTSKGGSNWLGKPSYAKSLDSMRLLEGLMTEKQFIEYVMLLVKDEPLMPEDVIAGFHATAEQRARAAVKVLGLEVESESI